MKGKTPVEKAWEISLSKQAYLRQIRICVENERKEKGAGSI